MIGHAGCGLRTHDEMGSACCAQKALAELKKGTEEVNPDDESRQRLRLLRGEGPPAAKAPVPKPAFRTAQVKFYRCYGV